MGWIDKALKRSRSMVIPGQYYNAAADQYEVQTGSGGAKDVQLKGRNAKDNTPAELKFTVSPDGTVTLPVQIPGNDDGLASKETYGYSFAKETMTISSTARKLTRAIYQDASYALVTLEGADSRVWTDGSVPSATEGNYFASGATIILRSHEEIVNFQAIRAATTDVTAQVTYFRAKSAGKTQKSSMALCTRNAQYNQGLSNGTDQAVTYRVQHTAVEDMYNPRLMYGNYYLNNGETAGPNDITVKAAIEYKGVMYPVTFNGSATATINPGKTVCSEEAAIVISKGDTFYTRTYVSVASAGQKWPVSLTTYTNNGEGKTTGDVAYSGATTSTFEYAYSPCAIVSQPLASGKKSIYITGDSIASGQGQTPNDNGFIVQALSGQFGWLRVSKPGAKTADFLESVRRIRMTQANYCTHSICQYGINDVTNGVKLEVIKANLINIWTALTQKGHKVYQTTITPVSTSTDSWATDVNQTTHANNAIRTALNDWIRTCPYPLSGYFEVADIAETARNSGLWKPGYTSDGTHPNNTGHPALVPAIDTTVFN